VDRGGWRSRWGMTDDHDMVLSGWMFLLVQAHPGCLDKIQRAVKWLCVCSLVTTCLVC